MGKTCIRTRHPASQEGEGRGEAQEVPGGEQLWLLERERSFSSGIKLERLLVPQVALSPPMGGL